GVRGEAVGLHQRGPAGGKRRLRVADGQEVRVAPQRVRARLDPPAQLIGRALRRRVRDLERAEAALADEPRLERVGGGALLALQGICRHLVLFLRPVVRRRETREKPGKPNTASPRLFVLEPDGIATLSRLLTGQVGGVS